MPTFTTTVDLSSATLAADIERRAQALEQRMRTFAADAEGFCLPEDTVAETAKFYKLRLRARDVETVRELLDTLVGEAELQTETFWGTELGRAAFALSLFPEADMPRSLAQTILGIKSRQRVHQLVVNGELVESMGLMISAESVRSLMVVR